MRERLTKLIDNFFPCHHHAAQGCDCTGRTKRVVSQLLKLFDEEWKKLNDIGEGITQRRQNEKL